MIDIRMVKNKVDAILTDLNQLKEFESYTFDQVAKDYRTHKVIERIIEVVVNEAIDINQHLIVKSGQGKLPFDFKESFLLLVTIGVYPEAFAKKIADSIGLRNILVHQYRKLDEQVFFLSIKDCFEQYTKYCGYILRYLEQKIRSKLRN